MECKIMYLDPDKAVSLEEMGFPSSGEIRIEETHGKEMAELIDGVWKKMFEGVN